MLHQIEQTAKMGLVTLSKFLISLSLILCCYSPCTSAQWIGNSFTNVDIATTFPLGHLAELMQTHSPASWAPLSAIVPLCTSSWERAPVPSLGVVLQKCTPSYWKETWNTDFSSGLHCKISFNHCCLIACIICYQISHISKNVISFWNGTFILLKFYVGRKNCATARGEKKGVIK